MELQQYGAETASYLLPSRGHPVFGGFARSVDRPRSTRSERSTSAGRRSLLAAFGIYLLIRRDPTVLRSGDAKTRGRLRRHAPARRLLVVAAACRPRARHPDSHALVLRRPVTTYYRVYARIGVIVGIALVILAAPALDRLIRRYRWGPAIGCALLVLVIFELLPARVDGLGGLVEFPRLRPLALSQPRGIVAHYPLRADQVPAVELIGREIYYQMFHRQPLYNIVGPGTEGTREDAIRIMSGSITDPKTPGILAAEGVRYLLVHDDIYRAQGEEPPVAAEGFRLIRTFPGVRVFGLRQDVQPVDLDALLEQQP